MSKIKAVIFDWGGVLIDDPAPGLMSYCADALDVPKDKYIEAHQLFHHDFQIGLIEENTFWQNICKTLDRKAPDSNSLWYEAFKYVYKPKEESFKLAENLKAKGFKVGFLSNTEKPAVRFFGEQKYDIFATTIFSCEVGVAKPQTEIYELALKDLNVQAEQTIFIDDKQAFTNGAKTTGLNTILFKTAQQIDNDLRGYIDYR